VGNGALARSPRPTATAPRARYRWRNC